MGDARELEGRCGVCPGETDRETPEVLAAIRRGDADALDALARRHAPGLFRVALRLTGRREDAEDLVQETLVRALPKLAAFEGRASVATYLFRVLANLWKNRLRSRKRSRIVEWLRSREQRDEHAPPEVDPADPRPLALEQLEREERAARVRDALAAIEPARRLTLLLREVQELPYEQIAEITAVPVGTVRSRLARAREDLRLLLRSRS